MKNVVFTFVFLLMGSVKAEMLNYVKNISPPLDYIVVCFKDGQTFSYQSKGGIPVGQEENNICNVGDIGFIIEKNVRNASTWAEAMMTCRQHGMRLPSEFEWQISCFYQDRWFVNDMKKNPEWASNTTFPIIHHGNWGTAAIIMGGKEDDGGCEVGSWNFTSYVSKLATDKSFQQHFRCAL